MHLSLSLQKLRSDSLLKPQPLLVNGITLSMVKQDKVKVNLGILRWVSTLTGPNGDQTKGHPLHLRPSITLSLRFVSIVIRE